MSLETRRITNSLDVNDGDKASELFKELIYYKDGKYQVAWPWKLQNFDLPVNLDIVSWRMRSLTRRFQRDPDLLKKYIIMQD